MRATCPAHLLLFGFILIITGEEYKYFGLHTFEWPIKNEFERNEYWPDFRNNPGILGWGKRVKYFNRDTKSRGRHSNRAAAEYKSDTLPTEPTRSVLRICEIWGSHGGNRKYYRLVCDPVLYGVSLVAFRRKALLPSSWSKC
jgi:hypothetical protein